MKTLYHVLIFTFFSIILFGCGGDEDNGAINSIDLTANAGPDQNVQIGSTVTLNGMDSQGSENLTYSWEIVNKPTASTAELTGATSVQSVFTLDRAGVYTIVLTVTDGEDEATDEIEVSNLPGIINEIDFDQDFSRNDIDGVITRRNSFIYIEGVNFSPYVEDMRVTLNSIDLEITELNGEDLYIDITDEASGGDLILWVGEEQTVYEERVYLRSDPIDEFSELPIFDNSFFEENGIIFERGIAFRPLVDGWIVGLEVGNTTFDNTRYTFWDVETEAIIRQIDFSDDGTAFFSEPLAVEAGKEYVFSYYSGSYRVHENTADEIVFPTTIFNEIEFFGRNIGTSSEANAIYPGQINSDVSVVQLRATFQFVAVPD